MKILWGNASPLQKQIWLSLPSRWALAEVVSLNDTGVLLWNKLKDGADEQDLARALTAEYDVSPETALQDVQDFLRQLQEAGCLEK